ncbi:MAG: hypothetical protein RR385_10410, partial [Clostridiales bacterium]
PKEDVTVTVTYVQRDFAIGYYDGNTSPKEKATIANSSATLTHGRIYNVVETGQYQITTPEIYVEPDAGYQIKSVIGKYTNAVGAPATIEFVTSPSDLVAGGVYTYKMPASNVDFTITFEEINYAITLDPAIDLNGKAKVLIKGVNGIISNAIYNSEVTVNVTPELGYEVDDVKVINNTTGLDVTVNDPNTIAKGGNFTFAMPDSAVTVQVIISPVEYAISYNTPANGTITDNDLKKDNTLEAKFTATPATGYQIDKVEASYQDQFGKDAKLTLTASQNDVTKATTYTYQMPASDVAVNVTFK